MKKSNLTLNVRHLHKRNVGKRMFDGGRPKKTYKLIRGFGAAPCLKVQARETVSRFWNSRDNGRKIHHHIMLNLLLLTSKGQKRPSRRLMSSSDWLRTTFYPPYNRRLLELLPAITGLCWTPQNDGNYEAQKSLWTNPTKSLEHNQSYCQWINTLSRSSTRSRPPSKSSFVPSSAFSLRLVMYLVEGRGVSMYLEQDLIMKQT